MTEEEMELALDLRAIGGSYRIIEGEYVCTSMYGCNIRDMLPMGKSAEEARAWVRNRVELDARVTKTDGSN